MSIQQVAQQAGVSVATVSRVFNLPDKVSPATRERVTEVALALGYLPNASARTLRTQRSRVLGVVLPTLLNPVFAECLEGIAQAATAAGYAIVPITTDYGIAQEQQAAQQLLAGNAAGMILVVSDPATSAVLGRLRAAGLPYVLLYSRHAEHPCVSIDNSGAVAQVVQRLARLGHRDIAMVSGQRTASDRAQQRYQGFLQGMEAVPGARTRLLEVPFTTTAAQLLAELLTPPTRPTALVCSNDLLAIRSLRAAHLCGLRVPQDLSVVGFDGIALGEELTPVLSTVVQPNHDIGRRGVELVLDALARDAALSAADSVLLEHGFREGESHAACPATASS
ncbi:LacI family DNA-binding transcriptional regulator [Xylophilus sp. GW821-FHT01B05]